MKTIKFKGYNFYYKIISYECGEYGAFTGHKTIFYDTELETINIKKYLLFGPIIKKKIYKELFILDFNIEDPTYSKNAVSDAIEKKVIILERKKEIESGKII